MVQYNINNIDSLKRYAYRGARLKNRSLRGTVLYL